MSLRQPQRLGLYEQRACLAYLGSRFRAAAEVPPGATDAAAGREVLDRYVLVHLAAEPERHESVS